MAEATGSGEVSIVGVTKRFGRTTAVENLDLTIPHGSYYCLLGPSGCGKTTILRMGGYTEQGGGVQPGSVWMPLPGSLLGARYFVTLFLPSRVGVLALAAKSTLVARRAGRVRSVRMAAYDPSGAV